MAAGDYKKRVDSALNILNQNTTSLEKAQSVISLLKGINSNLDTRLAQLSQTLSDIQNLQERDLIELSAENLPTHTEKDKKRKKALLLFIKSWNDLKNEGERIQKELNSSQSTNLQKTSNIASKAKGPLGLITIAAIVIVAVLIMLESDETKTSENQTIEAGKNNTIQAIRYQGKLVPLDQLVSKKGPDCDREDHYHAKNGSTVKTTDGNLINDPGACAFGKLSEVEIISINP